MEILKLFFNEKEKKELTIVLPCEDNVIEETRNILGTDASMYDCTSSIRYLGEYIKEHQNKPCYNTLENLNEYAEELAELNEEQLDVIGYMLDQCSMDLDDAIQKARYEEYAIYDCINMTQVAEEYVFSTGLLEGIPDTVAYFFDYEAYGEYLRVNGCFIQTDKGTFIEIYE